MNNPEGCTLKFVQIRDTVNSNLLAVLPECVEFIQDAMEGGGKVMVHCLAGVSRSASCVIAYIM